MWDVIRCLFAGFDLCSFVIVFWVGFAGWFAFVSFVV